MTASAAWVTSLRAASRWPDGLKRIVQAPPEPPESSGSAPGTWKSAARSAAPQLCYRRPSQREPVHRREPLSRPPVVTVSAAGSTPPSPPAQHCPPALTGAAAPGPPPPCCHPSSPGPRDAGSPGARYRARPEADGQIPARAALSCWASRHFPPFRGHPN
jgi:hypothetical protein